MKILCRSGAQLQLGRASVPCRPTAVYKLQQHGLPSFPSQSSAVQLGISRSPSCSSRHSRRRAIAHAAATEEIQYDSTPGDWSDVKHRSRNRYVNLLNQQHAIEDFVEFYQTDGGLAAVYIMHPNGHTLEINLQGATITRWLTPDGKDLLFTRSDVTYAPGEPINSGIPLAFPQWREGPLPFNGFADKLQWEVVGADLDFEFVNNLAGPDDFTEGRAELLLDENGQALVPPPIGIIDADDFADEGVLDDINRGLDAVYAEEEAEELPTKPKPKARGRKPKNAPPEAEAAAAATAVESDQTDLTSDITDLAVEAGSEDDLAAAGSSGSSEEDEAAAAAAAAAEGEQEDVETLDENELDYGIIEDPAPYVMLRLTDTEETRRIWPHKFELLYKITLMETDEFPDPKAGFPAGLHEWDGSNRPLRPEHEEFLEALDSGDEEAIQTAASEAALAEARELAEIEAGQLSYNGYRMFTDDDGNIGDDDDSDLIEMLQDKDSASEQGKKGKTRGKKKKPEEGLADAELADAGLGEAEAVTASIDSEDDDDDGPFDDGELPRELYNPPEQPMQVRMEWVLINKDDEDSEPFEFQLGALSHLRTQDQMRYGELVRILGLGGVVTFDYSEDPRRAKLIGNDEDYITFAGERRDTVYIGSHDAEVMFCPGNRTHFQLICREGIQDHVVYHPGGVGIPTLQNDERYFAQVGAGRLALPKKLAPGDMWKGEFVLRFNNKYWDPPVWDRDGPQPMPQIQPKQDEADDPDGLEEVEDRVEGLHSSSLGGGSAVPYLDE